jgi:hypothetical protein
VKWAVKPVLCFLIAWLPLAGFAAPAPLCAQVSSPVKALHSAVQHAATPMADLHAAGSPSTHHQTACHGSAGMLCCSVFAAPAKISMPGVASSSSVYTPRDSTRISQFIPHLPQRPPQVL